ncbi:hypothetical protein LAUMK136_00075 [Mycobacterium attenuatum]|uniref:Uncharacterized protein n=1 Tax=Mycobacterium attenuatum TaxID=2341086 RepID=A0A498PK08_9MYCO|nr:hypothetical protein LAUMK136_00075 [Mycobacterium attenuatum]
MHVISSTVYNDISGESTIIVVPISDHDPDIGSVCHWTPVRGWPLAWSPTCGRPLSMNFADSVLFRILATPDW